jgi:hypothetical protein
MPVHVASTRPYLFGCGEIELGGAVVELEAVVTE